jgi:hypothetical protein
MAHFNLIETVVLTIDPYAKKKKKLDTKWSLKNLFTNIFFSS